MTYIVAITGSIGSGKTTITNLFKTFNIPIIDADIIAKELVNYNIDISSSIINYFGKKITRIYNIIDRNALKHRIFNDNNERTWLNNLLHPIIIKRINALLSNVTTCYVILVVPLLIECNLQHYVNNITVINTRYENKVQRILNREDVNYKQINNILNTQVKTKVRLSYANIVIDNNLFVDDNDIIVLHQYYLLLATNKYIKNNFNNIFI
ncbi:MAG: dephospho-CoA kinase [Candidatus Lightella neohaematopini]|nr:dephospho-CoA kinase [Candidatus Lightella neohaematopini]